MSARQPSAHGLRRISWLGVLVGAGLSAYAAAWDDLVSVAVLAVVVLLARRWSQLSGPEAITILAANEDVRLGFRASPRLR